MARDNNDIQRGALTLIHGKFISNGKEIKWQNVDYKIVDGETGEFMIQNIRAFTEHYLRGAELVGQVTKIDGTLLDGLKGKGVKGEWRDFVNGVSRMVKESEATIFCDSTKYNQYDRPIGIETVSQHGEKYKEYDCQTCRLVEHFMDTQRDRFYEKRQKRIEKNKRFKENAETEEDKAEFQVILDGIYKEHWKIKTEKQADSQAKYIFYVCFKNTDGSWTEPYKWDMKGYYVKDILAALKVSFVDGIINALRGTDITGHTFNLTFARETMTNGMKSWEGAALKQVKALGLVPHNERPVKEMPQQQRQEQQKEYSWKEPFLKLKEYARWAARRYYGEQKTHCKIEDEQNFIYANGNEAIDNAIEVRVEMLRGAMANTDVLDKKMLELAEEDNWADFKEVMKLCYESVELEGITASNIDAMRNDEGNPPVGIFIIRDIL